MPGRFEFFFTDSSLQTIAWTFLFNATSDSTIWEGSLMMFLGMGWFFGSIGSWKFEALRVTEYFLRSTLYIVRIVDRLSDATLRI